MMNKSLKQEINTIYCFVFTFVKNFINEEHDKNKIKLGGRSWN